MDLTSAIHWWEESQLRVLVLSSLIIQGLLLLSSVGRRAGLPWYFRAVVWLTYIGSDAVAIYGLATLFNRHKDQDHRGGSSVLQVVWAPVLLMHLGGVDGISAYNIEDNDLWTRHVVTAVSQITVAIYVFCKTWQGSDKRLLQAAIVLFFPGVLKCLVKPWALKSASFNSLVSSSPAKKTGKRLGGINPLEDYVQQARVFAHGNDRPQALEEGKVQGARGISSWFRKNNLDEAQKKAEGDLAQIEPYYKLFVDHASPYSDRLRVLKHFWVLNDEIIYFLVRRWLSSMFCCLYTKQVSSAFISALDAKRLKEGARKNKPSKVLPLFFALMCRYWIRLSCIVLPLAAIGLFHHSHREDYSGADVKITYILLCGTTVLECYSVGPVGTFYAKLVWPETVEQYNLIESFTRNRRHRKKLLIVRLFGCKDYLDQHWSMGPRCYQSTQRITKLVLRRVEDGWKDYIQDAATYRMFNDHRGQWTLKRNECNHLGWSLERPLDESVLLWHIATDFCFYSNRLESEESTDFMAVQCSEISDYMTYLLFVNPEMLLPGSRRNLLTTAYSGLEKILKGQKPLVEDEELMQKLITKMQSTHDSTEEDYTEEGFIHDAWVLAQALLHLGDEKMWEVIQGVWVEMLCFSAGRCRGYLHGKALGTGGELLTYVWLLLSNMGMETFAERLQGRREFSHSAGNACSTSLTSEVTTGAAAPPTSKNRTSAAPSTFELCTATDPSVPSGASPSTSTICAATGNDMV